MPRPTRRTILRGVGAGLLPSAIGGGTADPIGEAVDDAARTAPSVFGEVGRRIGTLRYPLVGVPAIHEPNETLRVELDADPETVSATLVPSFGTAKPETDLRLESLSDERKPSDIWVRTDEAYTVAEFEIPSLDRQFTEGMYDLRVTVDGAVDGQPRAVSIHESFPDEPDIAIMGDPHVGDPRPFQDGGRESVEERSPEPFLFRYRETFGTGTEADRWGAFQRANAEVNASDPDIVLVIGDLAFGSPDYYQEYEDAYRVLNQLDAPTFVTLGNHDGYISPGAGVDGKKLWQRYFAPWHYSVYIRPDFHLLSMDSYDWPALDRIAPSAVPSTWGGQVRDEQLAWVAEDLRSWRAENDGTILTLSHHNPSWRQTEGGEVARTTDGIPAAEQAGRGAEGSGGGWLGKNREAVRALLREVDVSLHVSGHAHRDRIARNDGADNIAATTGTGLEYVDPDGNTVEGDAEAVLAEGNGTLFVEATTAASGTTQYWGWRTVPLTRDGSRVDPREFGYPATETFLNERALEPDLWSATNADLGLYSTPSYRFDASFVERSPERTVVRLENDLAREFEGAVTVPLGACPGVRVDGGEKRWQRIDGDRQDVRVTFSVPAGEIHDVIVTCASATVAGKQH
ncbi:MAG: 3',5'-cyclic AMP phosphodiesterase CpdA [Natronomonas sp.]